MIYIKEKKDCCGCGACAQRCPKSCITMQEDEEGFLYPQVDEKKCIDCGLCEKVCPVINQVDKREPLVLYSAIHRNDDIRLKSSSGGIFTSIAECVIEQGGVVFGAKFDEDWSVIHDYTENKDELSEFRGSKYVQSRISNNYKSVESFLKSGRKVLFSGTPCQVAGLKLYLRKEYDNLFTVDFICHGVPSPKVWHEYLKEEVLSLAHKENFITTDTCDERNIHIMDISFRNKLYGWKNFSFSLSFCSINKKGISQIISFNQTKDKNLFLKGFLSNVLLRNSCFHCPVKEQRSGSDITLADYWGYKGSSSIINDGNKGVSIVIINTTLGKSLLEKAEVIKEKISLDQIAGNICYFKSVKEPDNRSLFFNSIRKRSVTVSLLKYGKKSFNEQVRYYTHRLVIKFRNIFCN